LVSEVFGKLLAKKEIKPLKSFTDLEIARVIEFLSLLGCADFKL
jgi:hypothetical protein